MVNSVPFRPGPSLLRFHPKFSSTLLIGSQAGIFTLSDIQGTTPGPTYQVNVPFQQRPLHFAFVASSMFLLRYEQWLCILPEALSVTEPAAYLQGLPCQSKPRSAIVPLLLVRREEPL